MCWFRVAVNIDVKKHFKKQIIKLNNSVKYVVYLQQ